VPFSRFTFYHFLHFSFPLRQRWDRIARPVNKNLEITKTLINFGMRFGKREKVIFAKKIETWI